MRFILLNLNKIKIDLTNNYGLHINYDVKSNNQIGNCDEKNCNIDCDIVSGLFGDGSKYQL